MQGVSCRDYLQALVAYFESFYARTQPLGSLSKIYAKLADFEQRFKDGEIPGWGDTGKGSVEEASNVLDMTAFATVEEVEALGQSSDIRTLPPSPCNLILVLTLQALPS